LEVYSAEIGDFDPAPLNFWSKEVMSEALPTVMKKVIEAALPDISQHRRLA
jgi:hypothetical protein